MPKKSVKKKTTPSSKPSESLEKTLVHNLIELQKINIDLAEKFDKLTGEISSLLALFETAARSFAKNAPMGEYEKDKEFLEKIDKLLDQNKTLAKGLTIMEERLRERMYGAQPPQRPITKAEVPSRPLPRF